MRGEQRSARDDAGAQVCGILNVLDQPLSGVAPGIEASDQPQPPPECDLQEDGEDRVLQP
jgi:hypothetical protein